MIVKFDRGLLKVQIALGLFFSLVPLCLIISSLLNDSLYEDYFGKLIVLFFLSFVSTIFQYLCGRWYDES
ncbi:hypothetical protein [Streptococcus australis]|uniref:hypothetical protein n=1 Tax=Streptococcus australis TaxID=113107 RepID=UPI00232FD571|nr:hypothetical protein [Streptococcus australis]MDB8641712.1 hypothetical protein [Streptococcus australis]MDB8646828.1 hypothetical protein [Streptococcus australis]